MLLAIDTSTAWAGVCLFDAERRRIVDERVWHTGTSHTEQLIPTIDWALRQHGLAPSDLSAIAVAVGPGTFNGVRVAVSTAKMLARARGLPLVGVDTLEIYAAQARGSGLLVRPLLSAARGEAATALWRSGSTLERIEDDRIAGPDELFHTPTEPTLFTGELTDDWRAAVAGLGPTALLATSAQAVRRPAVLAELALARIEAGQLDDAAALQAIYLRPPHITKARR
jgi:tRNA threonylcarbamoyladenosine biosynthesis protein TsaB